MSREIGGYDNDWVTRALDEIEGLPSTVAHAGDPALRRSVEYEYCYDRRDKLLILESRVGSELRKVYARIETLNQEERQERDNR